jgi:hypothetical protein
MHCISVIGSGYDVVEKGQVKALGVNIREAQEN